MKSNDKMWNNERKKRQRRRGRVEGKVTIRQGRRRAKK
jgi:hypothetical protein